MDLPLNPSTISHCLLFIIPASICLPLAWITVSARLWTRVRILNSAGLDDIFMAISAVGPHPSSMDISHMCNSQ